MTRPKHYPNWTTVAVAPMAAGWHAIWVSDKNVYRYAVPAVLLQEHRSSEIEWEDGRESTDRKEAPYETREVFTVVLSGRMYPVDEAAEHFLSGKFIGVFGPDEDWEAMQ